MFAGAGQKSINVKSNQFWQHNKKPTELWSPELFEQKAEYIYSNPVITGFVKKPGIGNIDCFDYSGGKGLIDIEYL